MRNRNEMLKQYVEEYMNILESVEGEYLSKRNINRKISKKWNVPYDVIKELSEESSIISKK